MANLQIKIDDDKKQKWQSFTASVNLELPHLFNSEVEAYGADEKEATENLMAMLSDIATDVNKKLKKLDSDKPSGYMLDGVPIEEAIKANSDSKRQPIKKQTLDEFNNARQVAYGNNVQVEPLTDSNAPPDNDSDSYVQEYPDYFIFTNKKTGKETKVDK